MRSMDRSPEHGFGTPATVLNKKTVSPLIYTKAHSSPLFLSNLSPAFELRPYQEDAYASFIVIGVPAFYHEKYENQFKDDFNAALKPATRTSEQ